MQKYFLIAYKSSAAFKNKFGLHVKVPEYSILDYIYTFKTLKLRKNSKNSDQNACALLQYA